MLRSKINPELFYIGSTKNFNRRYYNHKSPNLICNNPYLFNHIKKFGKEDLEFIILEVCDIYNLMRREQYYISELNPPYNIFRFASFVDSNSNLAKRTAYNDMSEEGLVSRIFNLENQLLKFINNEIKIPLNI